MLFNSFQFLWFLPISIVVYYLLNPKWRWAFLLGISYYFYMCWRPEYVVLILASTVLDYWVARKMSELSNQKVRKKYLYMSLVGNLGMLFTFKYFDFFMYNTEVLMGKLNIFYDSPILNVLLPMGISFYTFQTLSYTIDVYKGKTTAEKHLGYFALYVTYFPQLVAGPIERASRLLPQLKKTTLPSRDDVQYGINKILLGFFKKVVVADNIAVFCDQLFANPVNASGLLYAIAITLFIFQLFADFSGYSDIAIGTARLMGVRLMENFNRPFWSSNISEFWSKWHISLTSWIGDYIFKPMVKNWPKAAQFLSIFVMVLIGFWHGASWNFVTFGLLHGVIIFLQRHYKKIAWLKGFSKRPYIINLYRIWNVVLLIITGVFFRNSFGNSVKIFKHIVSDFSLSLGQLRSPFQTEMMISIFVCLLLLVTVVFNEKLKFKHQNLYTLFMLLVIIFLGLDNQNQFIYFQF
ncbi:MAG: MBOAT family protein [Bacteroidetes bacterium]|nr:MBOAT family protein [Bacteroidota bacterium]